MSFIGVDGMDQAFVSSTFLFRVSASLLPSGIAVAYSTDKVRVATPRNSTSCHIGRVTQGVFLSPLLYIIYFRNKFLSSRGQRAIKRASNTLVKIVFILIMKSGAILAAPVETSQILMKCAMHWNNVMCSEPGLPAHSSGGLRHRRH